MQVAETAGANYKFAYVWDKDITKDLKLSGTTVYVHKPVSTKLIYQIYLFNRYISYILIHRLIYETIIIEQEN